MQTHLCCVLTLSTFSFSFMILFVVVFLISMRFDCSHRSLNHMTQLYIKRKINKLCKQEKNCGIKCFFFSPSRVGLVIFVCPLFDFALILPFCLFFLLPNLVGGEINALYLLLLGCEECVLCHFFSPSGLKLSLTNF